MNHFAKKVDSLLDRLVSQVKGRVDVKDLTNGKLLKLNCLACSYSLTVIACLASLTMLITLECKEPIVGCLLIKVLYQIYTIILSTIVPQIFVVFFLSLFVIRIRGALFLKEIIMNLSFLTCLNVFLILSIVYLTNYNNKVSYKYIFIASLICPLISNLLSILFLKFLKDKL